MSMCCIASLKLNFKQNFMLPMGPYADVGFTSPKEHQTVMNLALKLS